MIKLINKTTGTPMWVADERVNEYLEAGHLPASEDTRKEPDMEAEVVEDPPKVPDPVKESNPTKKNFKLSKNKKK